MDEAEREDILRVRIAALSPDRFEQFVYELAHREDPKVERLKAPDGGADTVLPRGDGTAERVWQAKRYPKQINWSECEKSLSDAISNWKPDRVTFVFPRDLSKRPRKSFDTRLVGRPEAAAKKVTVDHWNLSRIVQLLGRHRDIADRFWPDLEGQTDKLDRVIKAGGRLESSQDLVERAEAIADFGERDVNFRSQFNVGGPDSETPNFDNLPYMMIEIRGERSRVQIATWVRDGAEVARPTLSFNDDDAGEAARAAAVRKLAVGEAATVTEGFSVAVVAPDIVKELTRDGALGPGSFDLVPGEPLTVCLEIDVDGETLSYALPLRPVPPPPGANAGWAAIVGRTLVELNFTLLAKPAIRASVGLRGDLEGTAAERAEAATLVYAFYAHDAIRIRSDVLFPGGDNVISGDFEKFGEPSFPADMAVLRDIFRDIAYIEAQLGIALPLPPAMSAEDADAAATIAQVLRTGEGSATFQAIDATVENPSAALNIVDQLAEQGSTVETVTYPLFGKTISLGPADYPIPELKLVKFVALGTKPDAPVRVRLEPLGDGEVTYRLRR